MASSGREDAARRTWVEIGHLFDQHRDQLLGVTASYGLRPPHAVALQALETPQPMSRLADLLRCDRSTMTWLADRLEERGLVVRGSDPGDRRVTLLELTSEGARVRDEIVAAKCEPPVDFERLSRKETEKLGRLVAKLRGELDEDS